MNHSSWTTNYEFAKAWLKMNQTNVNQKMYTYLGKTNNIQPVWRYDNDEDDDNNNLSHAYK